MWRPLFLIIVFCVLATSPNSPDHVIPVDLVLFPMNFKQAVLIWHTPNSSAGEVYDYAVLYKFKNDTMNRDSSNNNFYIINITENAELIEARVAVKAGNDSLHYSTSVFSNLKIGDLNQASNVRLFLENPTKALLTWLPPKNPLFEKIDYDVFIKVDQDTWINDTAMNNWLYFSIEEGFNQLEVSIVTNHGLQKKSTNPTSPASFNLKDEKIITLPELILKTYFPDTSIELAGEISQASTLTGIFGAIFGCAVLLAVAGVWWKIRRNRKYNFQIREPVQQVQPLTYTSRKEWSQN